MKKNIYLWPFFVLCLLMAACTDSDAPVTDPDTEEGQEEGAGENESEKNVTDMNATVDRFMQKYYLWNDDYKKLSRDLTIPYVDGYENFLTTTLMEMTTNTLDKKWNSEYGLYTLYSYIDRKEKKSTTRSLKTVGVNHNIEKEDPVKSYGIDRMMAAYIVDKQGNRNGEYAFVVEAVYPGSAATAWGVRRGTVIHKVNGERITDKNLEEYYLELLSPTKSQITLLALNDGEEINPILKPTEITPTPILKNSVIEQGEHKVGYLAYNTFDAAFDDELLEVLADFKSQGITDLVLDLRYNTGGHVMTCQMLSGCIAGSRCRGKVFEYYRFNDTRMADVAGMKKEGHQYDPSAGYFYENFMFDDYYGVNLANYALSLPHLYVLTTSSTASSAEWVIYALRGIDLPVTVIGEKTSGKNVGMEVTKFDKGDYSYELAPVSFQGYNAKQETIPEKGIPVDVEVDEWNNRLGDFGDPTEPLLAKALEMITGIPAASPEATVTRAAAPSLGLQPLPAAPHKRLQGAHRKLQGALMTKEY